MRTPFYFQPRSWQPVVEMGVLGLLAGLAICGLTFAAGNLVNPMLTPWAWGIGVIFGAVIGIGTVRWGRGNNWTFDGVRDLIFAIAGTTLAFALALAVLQIIPSAPAIAPAPVPTLIGDFARQAYILLACSAGGLKLVAKLMSWPRDGWTIRGMMRGWRGLSGPFVFTAILLAMTDNLFTPSRLAIMVLPLIAGILFVSGTALAMKTQRGVFAGFGPMTGALTIALLLLVLFDVYYRLIAVEQLVVHAPLVLLFLGTVWFGLLAAQFGYWFAWFIPDYDKVEARRRAASGG